MTAATDTRHIEAQISWGPSPLTRAIATCAALALGAALIGSRWQLAVFAAPLLGVLCSIGWQRPAPKVHLHVASDLLRCFEAEQAQLQLSATAESDAAAVELSVSTISSMRLELLDHHPHRLTMALTAQRWGHYPIRARVDVLARGGLIAGTATVDAAKVYVFPIAPAQSTAIPRTELPDRIGTHLTRRVGAGVEYANIRSYVPGDQLRAVNWPVSARRGSLHVTERLNERAADVVVLLDTYPQPPGPATEATERTVRGAVQVVQSALRSGDRAGIVALGGRHPRWLGADIGRAQFYRVLDAALAAGDVFETTTGTLAPRAAVPPGAIVVAFSTMLDTEFALALIELCKRGHVVIAVDVLEGSPLEGEQDPLITRMWALQRSFMHRDMATVGVDIVPWRKENTLDQALHLVPDRRNRSGRVLT
jgi:uncharacterized protein (DUF58 family)